MLHWHLTLILILGSLTQGFNPNLAHGVSTSNGPTSEQEAKILWNDGREEFNHGNYIRCVELLQRYIDRYPGYPSYLESTYFLGVSLLRTNRASEALPHLKSYAQTQDFKPRGIEARLRLSEAFLAAKKYDEALLKLVEIENAYSNFDKAPDWVRVDLLTYKARAHLGKDSHEKALLAIQAAEKSLIPTTPPPMRAEIHETQLKLKLYQCDQLLAKSRLTENQAKNQGTRLGACLVESLFHFQKILATQEKKFIVSSSESIKHAFRLYHSKCLNPPLPPEKAGQKRNVLEASRYQDELANVLLAESKSKKSLARDLIKTWDKELPPEIHKILGELLEELK